MTPLERRFRQPLVRQHLGNLPLRHLVDLTAQWLDWTAARKANAPDSLSLRARVCCGIAQWELLQEQGVQEPSIPALEERALVLMGQDSLFLAQRISELTCQSLESLGCRTIGFKIK
jgi:hypothetical protein